MSEPKFLGAGSSEASIVATTAFIGDTWGRSTKVVNGWTRRRRVASGRVRGRAGVPFGDCR